MFGMDPQQMLNNLVNNFGGFNVFQNKLDTFITNFKSVGMDPEQLTRQLIDDGRMPMEQFNKFASIANMITGRKM